MSQPEKPLGLCLFTEVMSGLIRGVKEYGQVQADILREAQLNRPLYDNKLVAPAPKDITIVPYVSGYFMKGSEFDVKPPACFLCGKFR